MLRKLMNPGPTDLPTSVGLLLLRLAVGGLMATHGYDKLTRFSEMSSQFPALLPIGSAANLGLAVFAEFFCALLLVLGLFTRAAAAPVAFTMIMAAFVVHGADPLAKKELALLYLGGSLALLFTGAGRLSVDGATRG